MKFHALYEIGLVGCVHIARDEVEGHAYRRRWMTGRVLDRLIASFQEDPRHSMHRIEPRGIRERHQQEIQDGWLPDQGFLYCQRWEHYRRNINSVPDQMKDLLRKAREHYMRHKLNKQGARSVHQHLRSSRRKLVGNPVLRSTSRPLLTAS